MYYLRTKSPIAKKHLKALIKIVEQVKTAEIDGVALSNLLRLCYAFGLKKGELIKLSVGDVAKGGAVNDVIFIGEHNAILEDATKRLLQNHIDYLKKNGYRLYPSFPLFPNRKKQAYSERTLHNHLKIFFSEAPGAISLDKIRKAAVCDFYDHLKNKGEWPQGCLEKTADFARITMRSTKDLLIDQIQPTGTKPDPYSGHLEKIEELASLFRASKNPKDRGDFEQIGRKIIKDPRLTSQEKKNLQDYLDKIIEDAKKLPREQNIATSEPQYKSIADAIKNLRDE